MDVLTKHVNEPPLPPRERQPDAPISEPMEEMILRALEKDPSLRPQNAEQFREELLAIPEKARSRTTPPEVEAVAPPPARPIAPLVAGIALVVVALAAVAVQLLQMTP
jgi:serine/threonine-protein kinase